MNYSDYMAKYKHDINEWAEMHDYSEHYGDENPDLFLCSCKQCREPLHAFELDEGCCEDCQKEIYDDE